jgi:hypothetical protein
MGKTTEPKERGFRVARLLAAHGSPQPSATTGLLNKSTSIKRVQKVTPHTCISRLKWFPNASRVIALNPSASNSFTTSGSSVQA